MCFHPYMSVRKRFSLFFPAVVEGSCFRLLGRRSAAWRHRPHLVDSLPVRNSQHFALGWGDEELCPAPLLTHPFVFIFFFSFPSVSWPLVCLDVGEALISWLYAYNCLEMPDTLDRNRSVDFLLSTQQLCHHVPFFFFFWFGVPVWQSRVMLKRRALYFWQNLFTHFWRVTRWNQL